MNISSNRKNCINLNSILVGILSSTILIIYACAPKATEVAPTVAPHCIAATMTFPAPGNCTSEDCCNVGDIVLFTFTRTDLPDSEPIVKNSFSSSYAPSTGFCRNTAILLTEELMSTGFGRWQVTHSFAPNWQVTCDEIEITEQTRCLNYAPYPGTPGDQVVLTTTRRDVDGCEIEIIDFD